MGEHTMIAVDVLLVEVPGAILLFWVGNSRKGRFRRDGWLHWVRNVHPYKVIRIQQSGQRFEKLIESPGRSDNAYVGVVRSLLVLLILRRDIFVDTDREEEKLL